MKKVLGLDIGTNSIGAAVINLPAKFEDYGKEGSIEWLGSRIIPTEGDYLKKFEEGQTSGLETKAAARRSKRGARRLKHRYKLRRTRLVKVFKILGWIDENFPLDDSRLFKKTVRQDENFKFSISDYLPFSEEIRNEFKQEMGIANKKRFDKNKNKEVEYLLPEDWIIYYLRNKALTSEIKIPELVRIIYMMNQRRGFKSSRKDLKDSVVLSYEDFISKKENKEYGENGIETQFVSITKIQSVSFKEEKKDKKGNNANVYTIKAEDHRIDVWEEIRKKQPDWEGKEVTFLVVQKIDKNGKFSQNKPQLPKEDDWALCTTALDEKIKQMAPGEYFFSELKKAFKDNKSFKIRQYPIYRWRYKKELKDIWDKQCELNEELRKINSDPFIIDRIAKVLYPTQAKFNLSKPEALKNYDLLDIISNDIIYYQRELKSQKNSISECRYEKRKGIDGEIYGLKCIPRSSPLFQEFRIWQDIHNIRILEREVKQDGKTRLDVDVTANYIDEPVKEKLFKLFNSKLVVAERNILELIKESKPDNNIKLETGKKEGIYSHRINLYANRDELKGNETLSRYRTLFSKAKFDGENLLNDAHGLQKLWHIDYSITSSDEEKSKKGITTALNGLIDDGPKKIKLIELFCKLPELKKEYGSYSSLAIKKMLTVMRCGKYWRSFDIEIEELERQKSIISSKKEIKEIDGFITYLKNIEPRSKEILQRLNDINHNIRRISEIADDDLQKQVIKSFIGRKDLTRGLGTYQAGYMIYNRHSEKNTAIIYSIEEFGKYIQKEIPYNSLRNPIVEKVVRETMFLVRDIWQRYGNINEIHIELGRDLKNNSEERKRLSDLQKDNFEEKQRIKQLLYELLNNGFDQYTDTEDSRPFEWETKIESNKAFEVMPNPESPLDIDKFKIWKSLSKFTDSDWDKKVKDEKIPTGQQVKKYALWLSQNCRSPYSGKIIPLSKLFDKTQYEIEHIIPKSKFPGNSFNNLVIAEAAINPHPYKGNLLARNFITYFGGKNGKEYEINGAKYFIMGEIDYERYCKETFKFQKGKLKNLLSLEAPEDFIQRQLNDTRYIGRKLSELLNPVPRHEDGSPREDSIIFTIGSITSELKRNWGLNAVWKDLLMPRFERLEKITGKQLIIRNNDEFGNPVIHFNVEENQGLNIKRIDHRHHALDALIIAATTREHIRYLNTLNATDDDEKKLIKTTLVKNKIRDFKKPWDGFTKQTKDKLEETIVTFKSSSAITSKPRNNYTHGFTEKGKPIEFNQRQKSNWMAVRRSMFKEPQGIIYLKEVYNEKNLIKAIEIQIDRMLVQNTPGMKLARYVYDKDARQIIKDLINRIGISITEKAALLDEIKKYLKKNKLKNFEGNEYEFIVIAKFEEYAAKRVSLDKSFDHKKIDKIPYGDRTLTSDSNKKSIPQILHSHLAEYEDFLKRKKEIEAFIKEKMKENEEITENDILNELSAKDKEIMETGIPEPFSGEGLEILAKKNGRPITKVTICEKKEETSKFGKQYVEVDAGANAYFVFYENQSTKEREGFTSVSVHKAIERLNDSSKHGIADAREGFDLLILSPGDLVYVPNNEERILIKSKVPIKDAVDWKNFKHLSSNIYKMTDTTQGKCLFVPYKISASIDNSNAELGSGNKSARAWDGEVAYLKDSNGKLSREDSGTMIRDVCIKLKVDRLGNIQPAQK